jgi:hypothetical protein
MTKVIVTDEEFGKWDSELLDSEGEVSYREGTRRWRVVVL